ncbi:MAG: hypothetical protein ACTMIR_10545 [Cellulomonadaceae bacterium]
MTRGPDGSEAAEAEGAAQDPTSRRRPRRAVRPGTEREDVDGVSDDEKDIGWSDGSEHRSDADYLRDVPPHWS